MKSLHKVVIYEMERGWGRREEGVEWYTTAQKAQDRCKEHNKVNVRNIIR